MGQLDGKVALVTGGASGIGWATAQRLASEGAHVAIADVNAEGGAKQAAELGARFIHLDVADSAAWASAIDQITSELGGLDVVHLNAGVTTQNGSIVDLTDDQYRRIMRANVDGVVFGTRACVPAMERRSGGAIVATASLAGIIAFAPDPIYTLTKHAVVGFVRSVAPQLHARGITINAVCPGVVDTPLVGEGRERLREAGFPMIAPEEIAAAVFECMVGAATGTCVVCQPGREAEPYAFHDVPGPRTAGAEGRRPPGFG
jgi:NAD(P)-dependent dehydrogenase (short-subunit alcohol dehydrogenase family)